jgi:uncharacterized SAM-binding protein YcdF (DUF218 family)
VFYLASKIFWIFASPINSLMIAALVGVLLTSTRFARAGRAVAVLAILLLIAAAAPPLGYLLIAPLEDRFPPPSPDMAPPDGIIILGGAVNGEASEARGQTIFDEGERMTAAVLLAQRYPKARIIFTGGNGLLALEASTEAPEANRFLTEFGVDPARITLERKSLNTDENARFTAELLHPGREQRWLLVTSAYHMTRSMGLFEHAGFNVIAYPVAYRTMGTGDHHQWDFDPARNLRTFELAMHEWIGLVAYWVTGRIPHLFPGPADSIA